jgi:hypothetical protein
LIGSLASAAPAPTGGSAAPAPDTTSQMIQCLTAALAAQRSGAQVWPGFPLHDQVLLLTNERRGVVVLAGDRSPPSEYLPVAPDSALFERTGAPPDSLRGLRTGLKWHAKGATATAVRFDARSCLTTLLHESFHTYQHAVRRDARFLMSTDGAVELPDSDPEASALLMLEGRFLAQALTARDAVSRLAAVRRAVVARRRRCQRVRVTECGRENDVELLEGSAEYAATAIAMPPNAFGRRRAVRDSARLRLLATSDLSYLSRYYVSLIGVAWIAIGVEADPRGWQDVVERQGIEGIIRGLPGATGKDTSAIARSREFVVALDDERAKAVRLTARERQRTDSSRRAFWSQSGVPIRFSWSPVNGLSSYGRIARSGDSEFGLRWPAPGNSLTVLGTFLLSPRAVVVIVPRDDLQISLGGREVSPSEEGRRTGGPLDVRDKGLAAQAQTADIQVWRDSVSIRLRPKSP